jgi:signal transduction histidine kinase
LAEAPERTARHDLQFDAPGPIVGEWDGDRLEQVVTNLVSNALKYSPDGGLVRVAVAGDSARAVITVSDQGIGIPPDEQARLFQPFARAKPAGRHIQPERSRPVGLPLLPSASHLLSFGPSLVLCASVSLWFNPPCFRPWDRRRCLPDV